LGGHHNTSDVDFEHSVGILRCVFQGGGLLLDTGSGNQTVHATFGVGDRLNSAVQELGVTDIDATVLEVGT
jgi:hypothetical protein